MSIMNELVYDRTQADVDRVFALKKKILTGGLTALSAEEKAEYMAGMKGAYNYGDMNRVGQAVRYIANRMTSIPNQLKAYREEKGVGDDPAYRVPYNPASVVVTAKTDWVMGDTPTQSQARAYINDIATLRKQLTLPAEAPAVPTTLDHLTYTVANNIEYLLYVIDKRLTEVETELYSKIDRTYIAFLYSAEVVCE